MLTAAVLTVTPLEESTGPAFAGRAVQAWFLELVRLFNPVLAGELHTGDGPRPYTVSDLVGVGPRRSGQRLLSPERSGWLRITTLTPELSAWLTERILPMLPGTHIDLGGTPVRIDQATVSPEVHQWAGQATPQALVTAGSLESQATRRVMLRFASPTTFRSQGSNVPFPLPDLVFGSLLNRWNAFAPVTLHPDARRFAEARIVASKYRLQSKFVEFARGQRGAAVGCMGTCRYVIQSGDRYWGGVIRTLAAYAFFSGVGARTTMGLGQAAPWDEVGKRVFVPGMRVDALDQEDEGK